MLTCGAGKVGGAFFHFIVKTILGRETLYSILQIRKWRPREVEQPLPGPKTGPAKAQGRARLIPKLHLSPPDICLCGPSATL